MFFIDVAVAAVAVATVVVAAAGLADSGRYDYRIPYTRYDAV